MVKTDNSSNSHSAPQVATDTASVQETQRTNESAPATGDKKSPLVDKHSKNDMIKPAFNSLDIGHADPLEDSTTVDDDDEVDLLPRWEGEKIEHFYSSLESLKDQDSSTDFSDVKPFLAHYFLQLVDLSFYGCSEIHREDLEECSKFFNIRTSGLKYALKQSSSLNQLVDHIKTEQTYCHAHTLKKEIHGALQFQRKTSDYCKQLYEEVKKWPHSEENNELIGLLVITAQKLTLKVFKNQLNEFVKVAHTSEMCDKIIKPIIEKISLIIEHYQEHTNNRTELSTKLKHCNDNQDQLKSNNPLGYEIFQGVLGIRSLPLRNKETDEFKVWENNTDYLFEHMHECSEESILAMASLSSNQIKPYLQSLSEEYFQTPGLANDLKTLGVTNSVFERIADGCVAPYVSDENPLYMYEDYKVVDDRGQDIGTLYNKITERNAITFQKILSEELLGKKENTQLQNYYNKVRDQAISSDDLAFKNNVLAEEINEADIFNVALLDKLFSSFWEQADQNLHNLFEDSENSKGNNTKKKNNQNRRTKKKGRTHKKTNQKSNIAVSHKTQSLQKAPTTDLTKQKSLHDEVHNKNINLLKEAFSSAPDLDDEEWIQITKNEKVKELDPHNKTITQFVCDSSCATGIIPPGPNSDIKPLKDFDNPLLKKITIYPSRESGSGETIDEHMKNNHPELYEKICGSCETSLDAINAIGQEMINLLNNIDSVSIVRNKEYKPQYGVSFVFPKLIIDGKLYGEPYRLVFSRPKNKNTGPVNNNYRILVPRTLHKIDRQPRVDENKFIK